MLVDLGRVARGDDARRVELGDDRRALDLVAGEQLRALVELRLELGGLAVLLEPRVGGQLQRALRRRGRALLHVDGLEARHLADGANANVRDLHIDVLEAARELLLVRGVELVLDGLEPLGVDRTASGCVNAKLVALALVAGVDDALQADALLVDLVDTELAHGLLLEGSKLLLEVGGRLRVGLELRAHHVRGLRVLVDHVRGEQTEGRRDARVVRHEDVLDADLGSDVAREQRATATLGDQRELTRVEALADRRLLDGVNHRVHEHLEDAKCGLLGAELQRLGDLRLDGLAGEVDAEILLAAEEQLGAQPAERDDGVGCRRLRATLVVGRRARHGAGRAGTDAEDAAGVDVRDRTAAGTNGVDVDHRDHGLVRTDLRVEQVLHAQLAVLREADVGRGATDVEGDDVALARDTAGPDAADDAGDRARHQQVDRAIGGRLGRRHTGGAGHQLDARLDAHLAELGVEAAHVVRDLRADERVERHRREALVLAVLRDDLGGDRDVRLGELLAHDRGNTLLVLVIQEREEKADGDGVDGGLLQLADLGADLAVVQRDLDRTVGEDALVDRQAVAAACDRERLPRQVLPQREVHRLLVPRDVDDVAIALRRDHADVGAVVLDHDVGGHGRTVEDLIQLRRLDAGHLAQRRDTVDGRDGGVRRRRRRLVHQHGPLLIIDVDQVGERSSDVDSDALHPAPPVDSLRAEDEARKTVRRKSSAQQAL